MDTHYDYELIFDDDYDQIRMDYYEHEQNIPNIDILTPLVKDKITMMAYILKFIPGMHTIVSFINNTDTDKRTKIIVRHTDWVPSSSENKGTSKIDQSYLILNDHIVTFFTPDAMEVFFQTYN